MEETLRFDFLEYSSSLSEAVYLRQPLSAEDLKRRFPRLRGIEFDFRRTAFDPLRYDHQAMFAEILEAFDFEEVRVESLGRATALPDALWKASLKCLKLNCRGELRLSPPAGFQNRLEAVFLQYLESMDEAVFDTSTLENISIHQCKGSLRGLDRAPNVKTLSLAAPVLDFDLRYLTKLEVLRLEQFKGLELLPDFSGFKQLREIRLANLPQLQRLPGGLDQLPNLEKLWLIGLGHVDNRMVPFAPGTLPALKVLNLQNCRFLYII